MKNNKKTLIFILCYIAYSSTYISRLNLSLASPQLIEESILTTSEIGLLGSVFFIIYAVGRLLNGFISDRAAPWFMISTGLMLAGLSNILIGYFPPFIGILLLWGSNAYAQSMLWSSILCIISNIYDEQTAKKKNSYMATSIAVGNILGIILNTVVIMWFGVAFAFIVPGTITLILSVIVMLSMRCVTIKHINHNQKGSIWGLAKNKTVRALIAPAMVHGVIKENISLWMIVYFVDQFNIDLSITSGFVLFIPIIGFAGRLAYPFLYKFFKYEEHTLSLYAFALCTLLPIPLLFTTVSPVVAIVCISLMYALISIINTSFLSIFPARFIKTGAVASVSGFMDFATYCGSGLGSLIYGFTIHHYGYSTMFGSWFFICLISVFIYIRHKCFKDT